MEELLQELIEFLKGVGEQAAGSGIIRSARPVIDWARSHHSVVRHAVAAWVSAAARRIRDIGCYKMAVWSLGMAASSNVVVVSVFALIRGWSAVEVPWWSATALLAFYAWILATVIFRTGKVAGKGISKLRSS